VNGALAVARYTLLELSRRRILLVFFIIGVAGVAIVAIGLKIFAVISPVNFTATGPPGSTPPDPALVDRFIELIFVSTLINAVGFFALLVAFAIGMTAIYHDLESGAAVGIFSKPVSRFAFTAGKLAAAVVAIVVLVGLVGLEARLAMFLFGGGLEGALWVEMLAAVANAVLLMLIVLALSTWMNNIVAAVVAFIYNAVAGVVVALHAQLAAGQLGDNGIVKAVLDVAYWIVPHDLMSDAARQIVRAQFDVIPTSQDGPTVDQMLAGVPGASDLTDIIWWVFLLAVTASLVYIAVRRRQV
jgi:ABC-type transport system involved in multi-copper enzyme maturation permease subunit